MWVIKINLKEVNNKLNTELNKRDLKTTFKITREDINPNEMIIEGYFALYEQETELFEGSYEIITKGAFDTTLNNDIRALWNHNTQYVLGRNKSGTLEVKADDKGLFGLIKLPQTQYAQDLYNLVQRGDVDQCSFGFNILYEDLEELANGGYRWRINEIDLHEISVVTFPAYENTSVKARSKEIKEIEQRKIEQRKKELLKRLEEMKTMLKQLKIAKALELKREKLKELELKTTDILKRSEQTQAALTEAQNEEDLNLLETEINTLEKESSDLDTEKKNVEDEMQALEARITRCTRKRSNNK